MFPFNDHREIGYGGSFQASARFLIVYSGTGTWGEETPIAETEDITGLLDAIAGGDKVAGNQLFSIVYDELRQLARRNRSRWSGDDTMNTTALIHETYLKLAGQASANFRNRGHFFATAAKAMRHILVNYAERRRTAKRGGDAVRVPLEDHLVVDDDTAFELLVVERALKKLEEESERACAVFECKVFGGLSFDETAEALQISKSTARRDWVFASAVVHDTFSSSAAGSKTTSPLSPEDGNRVE